VLAQQLFDLQIFGGLLTAIVGYLISQLLTFAQCAQSGSLDRGNVNEYVFPATPDGWINHTPSSD
jgi:hypothetical protein